MAKKISKELEQIIINNFKAGKTPYWMVENIEELKDKRPSTIYGILERLHLKPKRSIPLSNDVRKKRRKYDVNDDYFEIIDTEHKAYWLGFMYADGYILSDRDTIGISLSVKDITHIEKFKRDVSSQSPIKTYIQRSGYKENTLYSRLLIRSKKMKEDLIKHGVFKKKTNTLKFPKWLDKKLFPHFIRGYFDGDGCLTHGGKCKNGNTIYNIKIVGTKNMLINIEKILKIDIKLQQRHPKRNVDNWTLTINGNQQVKKIMNYLYKDSTIFLNRKYERYLELIKQYKTSVV